MMPVQVLMPMLPASLGAGTLARWLVGEGDEVTPGMVIAEIETATATMEIEAVVGGTVARILVAAGTPAVEAAAPIAELRLTDEPAASRRAETPRAPQTQRIASDQEGAAPPARRAVSPLARRLARERGVDLVAVQGSGPGGRIVKRDVEAAALSAGEARSAAVAVVAPGHGGSPRTGTDHGNAMTLRPAFMVEIDGADRARRSRVARLTRAAAEVPHAYFAIDCRLDEMLRTRARINAPHPARSARGDAGVPRLTINDFVVKAWAMALQRVPAANATVRDGVPLLHRDSDVCVGMAGGFAPVIRQAQVKTLSEISAEIRGLRAGQAALDDADDEEGRGASSTVCNLGMFGIASFESVVHAPQATLLSVGAAIRRPVVAGDGLEIGTVMSCTLACDQRAIDADVGATLLASFRSLIEDPVRMLV